MKTTITVRVVNSNDTTSGYLVVLDIDNGFKVRQNSFTTWQAFVQYLARYTDHRDITVLVSCSNVTVTRKAGGTVRVKVSPRTAAQKRRTFLMTELLAQRRWIEEHGGTRQGYVNRYGSVDDADHYGAGGEAIYAADTARLDQLQRDYEAAVAEVVR